MKAGKIIMEVATISLHDTVSLAFERSVSKKTRRGKKRKSTPFTEDYIADREIIHSPPPFAAEDDDLITSNESDHADVAHPANCSNSDAVPDTTFVTFGLGKGAHQQIIRPVAPMAPNNYNQFLMNDHEDSNLYTSFETASRGAPSSRRRHSTAETITDSEEDSDGSPDQSVGTWDCSDQEQYCYHYTFNAFSERDFEQSYRRVREEELHSIPRNELVEKFINLEDRAMTLDGSRCTGSAQDIPAQVIARLQDDLLRLQEENVELKQFNRAFLRRRAYEEGGPHPSESDGGHFGMTGSEDGDVSDDHLNAWSSDDYDDDNSSLSGRDTDDCPYEVEPMSEGDDSFAAAEMER